MKTFLKTFMMHVLNKRSEIQLKSSLTGENCTLQGRKKGVTA